MWLIAEPPLAFSLKNVGGGFLNEGKETISPQRHRGDRDLSDQLNAKLAAYFYSLP